VESLATFLRHLHRLLRRRGEARDRAEDLVQEAYLRMQVYCKEGNEVREPEAFLARTALNLAVDLRRRDQRDRRVAGTVDDPDLLPELVPAPDAALELEQRLTRIQKRLDRLSERTRVVFLMHRVQGYSYMEIAQRLRISVSSVEKHVASAVALLSMERKRE
jgi:RNA polymerase sigma factor (sigma-70 family)